jgi:hypothetical protein
MDAGCTGRGTRKGLDEAYDLNHQSGGRVSNPQDWTTVRHKTTSDSWVSPGFSGGTCPDHGPTNACQIVSGDHVKTWDTRVP